MNSTHPARFLSCLALAASVTSTPLSLPFKQVGEIRPRPAKESRNDQWRLGCETLDRDYIDFETYKEHVGPLGIRIARLQGGWAKCEKQKGVYDFAWLDRVVDYLIANGVEPALETNYGNPIYPGGGTVDLAAGFPTSEEGLAGWDAWVDAITKHFKGRVRIWMMWNEPDLWPLDGSPQKTEAQVAAFNVRTAKIVHRNVPGAKVGALSLAFNNTQYFENCLKAMGKDVELFDTVVYHGYMPAPESSYESVEQMKAILAKYNPKARLWQGENGCPSETAHCFALSRIPWTETSQAKWDMRRMLGDLGHDVYSSVFTICDFNHKGREINRKGLIRANAQKKMTGIKPAYYSVRNVATVFDETLSRVADSSAEKGFGTADKTVTTYHYVKEGKDPLFVFWEHTDKADKKFERPKDSYETRPVEFTYTGKPLKDPVFVDLLSGRIYAFPAKAQVVEGGRVRFLDVPVYDSPCVLTERRAVMR